MERITVVLTQIFLYERHVELFHVELDQQMEDQYNLSSKNCKRNNFPFVLILQQVRLFIILSRLGNLFIKKI